MNRTMKQAIAWLMVLRIVLAGCAAPVETQAPPTNTVAPSPAPTTTPTRPPTAVPTRAVATETPTIEPSVTAVVMPTLTVREPSIQQLETYLKVAFPNSFYGFEGKPKLIYQDVSGDGRADLIVDGFLQVVVMLWTGDHYVEPFRISYEFWKYDPGSRVFLEDWTRDGIPDVVFDYRGDNGSTGTYYAYWQRHIIHCSNLKCELAWSGILEATTAADFYGGMDLYLSDIQLLSESDGALRLRYSSRFFSIYSRNDSDHYLPALVTWDDYSSLHVVTSTVSSYLWTGSKFELTDTQIVSLPYTIEARSSLFAANSDGITATISVEPNHIIGEYNDVCQLFVDGQLVGPRFGCKGNFTTVEWKDITGDGVAEIIVVALSGGDPRDTYDRGENPLDGPRCVHQHLLAYQWKGNASAEIANVTGCVVREDLYGVRLEDFDKDGQVEILASNDLYADDCQPGEGCWYEPVHIPSIKIYKWNGTQFVFWDDVPGQ